MKKKLTQAVFICQNCGHQESKWHGRCALCQEWNTLVESRPSSYEDVKHGDKDSIVSINSIKEEAHHRVKIGIDELDLVLGGGLVLGSVILLGGEPGCGKSTLLQMTSAMLARNGFKVLYISGEESKQQIYLGAQRLNALHEHFFILCDNVIETAFLKAKALKPDLLIIDSIQTMASEVILSPIGSISQVREVCAQIINFAKKNHIPVIIVGHVTKDGNIAGPRLLEHMVDTVLYFEQSHSNQYRMLRSHKNRFGASNEVGIFEMTQRGLIGMENPSSYFLAERSEHKPGSAIFCIFQGSRPLLVEIQALAVASFFGNPKRTCVGMDSNRCAIIAAVLEKYSGISLSRMDLFISVAQGIEIKDPAADLALALAIASSVQNMPLPQNMMVCGEVGLSGEIKNVYRINERIKEASRLGFSSAIVPQNALEFISDKSLLLKSFLSVNDINRFLV